MNREQVTGDDEGIVRVVVTADNHLSAYSPKLSPAKLAERRRRLGMAFKQTVDTAIERRVHLFIQAGDLFDSVDPRNREHPSFALSAEAQQHHDKKAQEEQLQQTPFFPPSPPPPLLPEAVSLLRRL